MIGNSGYVGFINATRYTWRRTAINSYQMGAWDRSFPAVIEPGQTQTVFVQFDEDWDIDSADDKGEVRYLIETADSPEVKFLMTASNLFGFSIAVETENCFPPQSHSTIALGWLPNRTVNFILSGEVGCFSANNPPVDWMQSSLPAIGDCTLRQICIPGSHDAGISTRNGGTPLANSNNTKTQSLSVAGQLVAGVRYLDIRPVIGNGGKWYAGHYGYTKSRVGWQGWNGQSLHEIVDQINIFLLFHKELVIVDVSHGYNTDSDYRNLNDHEWHHCFEVLSNLEYLFVSNVFDLTQLTLSKFIGGKNAAVVVISRGTWNLGTYRMKGFYTSFAYDIFDSYANDVHPDDVIKDQLLKMQTWQEAFPPKNLFLLAWTASQTSLWDVLTTNIKATAAKLNPRVYHELLPACTRENFPNIISQDFVENNDIAALAIAINYLLMNIW